MKRWASLSIAVTAQSLGPASGVAGLLWLLAPYISIAAASDEGQSAIWRRHTIDATSRGADGIRLADFDRDGHLDIVTGWEEGGVTRVYLNPGPDAARRPWPRVTVGRTPSVEDAVAVDLDSDGWLDVVSCCEGRTKAIYVHWSPASFDLLLKPEHWVTDVMPASEAEQMWMYCLPFQMDGQRGVDLVVGSKGSTGAVGWWESPDDPRRLSDWRYHRVCNAGWIMSILACDMDGDEDADILYSDRRGPTRGIHWLELPSTNSTERPADSLRRHTVGGTNREVMFLAVGDIDQDGFPDIAEANRDGTIELFFRQALNPPAWQTVSLPAPFGYPHGKSIAICDLDGDGRVDLASTHRPQPADGPAVVWSRFRASARQSDWATLDVGGPEGSKFDLIEPLDLDGDGDLDLITCEEVSNLGVFWYENPTRSKTR